jgi:hypothetical protein
VANDYITNDIIAKEVQRLAHEKATFIGSLNKQYDESYKVAGGKRGSTLRIKQPNQYVRRQGSRVMDVQDADESAQTLTVATQDGVDLKFNSAERVQKLDDFVKEHLEPAMAVLISGIESDVLVGCTKEVYQTVGTAGTVVGYSSNDISAQGNARAKLNQSLAPKDKQRAIQVDSVTMASIANAVPRWFEPGLNKEAFVEGMVGRSAMADFYENERTWTMSNGSDVTSNTAADAAVTDGGTNITADNVTVTVGQVFTVAGVYACHPETKQAYSHLQQFVITAGTTGALTVSPATYLTGAKKNVSSSTGGDLAVTDFNSKAMTFHGAANTAYRQNLMYHPNFATFVTADLPMMPGECARRVKDGISVRVWSDGDIRNDELLTRIDILYGSKVLYPEWACRVSN